MLPGFRAASGFTCEPTDIVVPWRHLEIARSGLVETGIVFFGLTTGRARAGDNVAVAGIVHGEFMDRNAVTVGQLSGNRTIAGTADGPGIAR